MKFLKKPLCFLLALLCLTPGLSFLAAGAKAAVAEPQIGARNVYLVEANTGRVLLRKNERERINPASTTKIMTTLLAVEAIEAGYASLADVVTVKNGCYFDVSADASIQDMRYGELIPLSDVLYCVMVASACEACNVVAMWISGSVEAFLEEMNDRAAELGCLDTHFANTHGLTNEQHWTTAYDLYLIYREAMKHELFRQLAATAAWRVEPTNKKPARTIYTTNKLQLPSSSYYYEYCTGGKTGSTSQAGYCLVSSADNNTLSLISVLMGDRGVDKNGNNDRNIALSDTIKLFEWGFTNFSFRTILPTTHLITQVPVEMGDGVDSVLARPGEPITALARNDLTENDLHFRVTLYPQSGTDGALVAPVTAGDVLGETTVTFYDDVTEKELTLGTVPLVANTSVALSKTVYLKARADDFLHQKWLKWAALGIGGLLLLYLLILLRYAIIRIKRRADAKDRAKRRIAASDDAQKQGMAPSREPPAAAQKTALKPSVPADPARRPRSFSDDFDIRVE